MTYRELLDHLNTMTSEELKEEVILEFEVYDPKYAFTAFTDRIHIHRSLDDLYIVDRTTCPLTAEEIEEGGGTTDGLFTLLYKGQTYITAVDESYQPEPEI